MNIFSVNSTPNVLVQSATSKLWSFARYQQGCASDTYLRRGVQGTMPLKWNILDDFSQTESVTWVLYSEIRFLPSKVLVQAGSPPGHALQLRVGCITSFIQYHPFTIFRSIPMKCVLDPTLICIKYFILFITFQLFKFSFVLLSLY